MDITAISSLIGSLGFPIFIAVYMLKLNKDQEDAHKAEISILTEAVNKLEIAITKMSERLDK